MAALNFGCHSNQQNNTLHNDTQQTYKDAILDACVEFRYADCHNAECNLC
jgi:hypothetical protein